MKIKTILTYCLEMHRILKIVGIAMVLVGIIFTIFWGISWLLITLISLGLLIIGLGFVVEFVITHISKD